MTQFVAAAAVQSSLRSAAEQARAIENAWWIFFWISLGVYVIVMAALLLALIRRRQTEPEAVYRRALPLVVGGGIATAVILVILTSVSFVTGRAFAVPSGEEVIHVEITGHQWWWAMTYVLGETERIETANELHIPAGIPVQLALESRDVIHSFWVPNLHGKMDLIPGRTNSIVIKADRPGIYRGQCAEFCGLQHAHMGLLVVVEPPERFEQWLANQQRPAVEPQSESQRRGREVFLTRQCAVCHTIRGAGAHGQVAPDLTHIASRRTLAAATIQNGRGQLAGWIADPQSIKPGNRMPPSALGSEDLNALLDYLGSLR